jgi:hypothetical protein
MIRMLFAALFVTLLAGCNGIKSSPSYTLIDSKRVIRQAETAITNAKKVGYLWRDTDNMLTAAKDAEKKGDYNTAVAMAGKAERQAQNAVEQYHTEMKVFKN